MRLPVVPSFYCCVFCHVIDRDPARNPEPAEPVPEDEASWLARPDDDHAPGRLTQMGTQSLTIRPAAVDLEAEAEE